MGPTSERRTDAADAVGVREVSHTTETPAGRVALHQLVRGPHRRGFGVNDVRVPTEYVVAHIAHDGTVTLSSPEFEGVYRPDEDEWGHRRGEFEPVTTTTGQPVWIY